MNRLTITLVLAAVLAVSVVGGATAGSVITGRQIKDGTVTGKDVANRSLTRADLRGGAVHVVSSGRVLYRTDATGQAAVARCPAGTRAMSGGGINLADGELFASMPLPHRRGWYVIGVDDPSDGGTEYVEAVALCSTATQTIANARTDASLRQYARVVARMAAGR